MATLVTGGAGFIGSHLCDFLVGSGARVFCIDNLVTGRRANIAHLLGHPRFTFLEQDVCGALPGLPRLDEIYHLASPASPPTYQRLQVATMRVNSEGTRQLLELAARHGSRFLYASTSEVYGDPLVHPQPESYRGNVSTIGPRSMYDEAKRFGEALTQAYRVEYGVDTRIVRIFNTYGPRLDPGDGRVVSNFLMQGLGGRPLTIYGDGSQTRSFQYVDDLVAGITRLMASTCHAPVNLGNPEEYRVIDLARLVHEVLGNDTGIEFHPLPGDDPRQRRPDISLAWSELGWKPSVSVADGLRRTVEHFRSEMAQGVVDPRLDLAFPAGQPLTLSATG
jgi:dTDP-glucose 4,6-dehydratase